MKKKGTGLTLAAVCIFSALSLTSCGISKSVNAGVIPKLITPQKQDNVIVTVKRNSIQRLLTTSGKVTPKITKNMSFSSMGGDISKLNVKAGDTVKRGDVIAELKTDDIRFQVKEQQIRVQLAKTDVDEIQAQADASQYNLRRAQLNLQLAQLNLDKLNENLNNSILKSDMQGVVTYTAPINIGQHIDAQQVIATVADSSSLQVECDKPIENIKVNNNVKIMTGNYKVDGIVRSNVISKDGKTGKITIEFSTQPTKLYIDNTVLVQYADADAIDVLTVPSKAISLGAGNHPYVKILKNGDVIEKYIDTGIDDGTNTEVTNGLSEGEEVICN